MPSGDPAMGKKKTSLPDRWTHYQPLGKRIPGTRFIAFKVPLKKSFEWRLAPNERFSPLDLINQVREQQEELGLIIDLTYTTRYYEPEELPDTMQYCKILTIGHEIPDNETILKFKGAVKNFLMENQHNDKLIGVHCTHGLNRTGYLVCRYLIDVEGIDPNTAIELFNRYRGHSIERKNYVEDLKRRQDRRNHPAAVSRYGQTNERFGFAPNCDVQVADCRPRKLQQFPSTAPRHFASRRGRGEQDPHRRHYSMRNPNLLTCYDNRQSVYSPQYPPAAGFIQQRWNHSVGRDHGLLHPPYQQQTHVYEGPYLPRQIPHYLQQFKINGQPSQNPY